MSIAKGKGLTLAPASLTRKEVPIVSNKSKLQKRPAVRLGPIFRWSREAIVEMIFPRVSVEPRVPRSDIPVGLVASRWPVEPR